MVWTESDANNSCYKINPSDLHPIWLIFTSASPHNQMYIWVFYSKVKHSKYFVDWWIQGNNAMLFIVQNAFYGQYFPKNETEKNQTESTKHDYCGHFWQVKYDSESILIYKVWLQYLYQFSLKKSEEEKSVPSNNWISDKINPVFLYSVCIFLLPFWTSKQEIDNLNLPLVVYCITGCFSCNVRRGYIVERRAIFKCLVQ